MHNGLLKFRGIDCKLKASVTDIGEITEISLEKLGFKKLEIAEHCDDKSRGTVYNECPDTIRIVFRENECVEINASRDKVNTFTLNFEEPPVEIILSNLVNEYVLLEIIWQSSSKL